MSTTKHGTGSGFRAEQSRQGYKQRIVGSSKGSLNRTNESGVSESPREPTTHSVALVHPRVYIVIQQDDRNVARILNSVLLILSDYIA